jgi:integrase
VFTTSRGRPLDKALVRTRWLRACQRTGIGPVRVHDLRHTAASWLLAKGVHPRVIQTLLGHANVSITLNIYNHPTAGLLEQAVGQLDGKVRDHSVARLSTD